MLPLLRRLLIAGVLLLVRFAPLAAQDAPRPHDVVVNEIHYAPSPSQNEFIELYNRSERTVDLHALSFSDDREQATPVTGTERLLAPGAYVALVRDAAAFEAAFPGVPYVAPPQWPALNNSGDAVVLYAGTAEIDRVPYTPAWGGTDDRSLERIDPAGPSDHPSNFGSSTAPEGATPAGPNSIYAPDEAPPVLRFAEVAPPDTVTVYFDEPIAAATPAEAFALDDGRAPQALQRSDDGLRVDLAFAEAVSGLHLRVDGVDDLVGNALRDASTYLAYPAGDGDLAFNEVLFAPQADDFDDRPNQPEYFELANRAGRAVSLRGLFWTDTPDETGAADTTWVGGDVWQALPPEGLALVFAEPEDVADPAAASGLARAFSEIDFAAPDLVLLPIGRTSLGLRNDGDLIRLHRVQSTRIAEVRYRPGWHAPAVTDTRGIALERISLTAPADAPSNWTSSVAPSGGTPGRPNTVALEAAPSSREDALTVAPSPFSPDGDGVDDVTRIRYRLDADVALVRARIYDALGRHVRTLEEARLAGRRGELLWDGRGEHGRRLRIGVYVVLFEALDVDGASVVTLKRPVVLARPLG